MASRGSALPGNPGQRPCQIITPPPAYGAAPPSMPRPSGLPTPNAHNDPDYSDDEEDGQDGAEDGSESLSPIIINIKNPLYIQGDHNVVNFDTANAVNKIAHGVVNALKVMSMSGHGVPMIDEDGRPRPIKVTAEAGVRITGSRNIVGQYRQGLPTMPQSGPRPKQENKEPTIKREREGSEEAEAKRARLQ